jgi:hypothetical protein
MNTFRILCDVSSCSEQNYHSGIHPTETRACAFGITPKCRNCMHSYFTLGSTTTSWCIQANSQRLNH